MKVIYALQEIPKDLGKSIFLAGPIPRKKQVKSWRLDAIKILNDLGFDGVVITPEPEDGHFKREYDNQIEWEWDGLERSTVIAFWIPRDLKDMPAFTTNIEWGRWYTSGRVVLGYPEQAPKMNYLKYCAKKYNIPLNNSLVETLKSAINKIK